jgi:hypothetical protein
LVLDDHAVIHVAPRDILGQVKLLSEFPHDKSKRGGYGSSCEWRIRERLLTSGPEKA